MLYRFLSICDRELSTQRRSQANTLTVIFVASHFITTTWRTFPLFEGLKKSFNSGQRVEGGGSSTAVRT